MKNIFALLFLFCFLLSGNAQIYAPVYNPPAVAGKSFVFVNFAHNFSGPKNGSVTNSVTTGNTVVVVLSGSGSSATHTCADDHGNTYNFINSSIVGTTGTIFCWVATNATGGTLVITTTTTLGDKGVTAMQFSGVTAVDVSSSAGHVASMNCTNITTAVDMFVSMYADEDAVSFVSTTLNPGSVAGTLINNDTGHTDAEHYFANGSSGFSAGTYTNTAVGAITAGMIFLALK